MIDITARALPPDEGELMGICYRGGAWRIDVPYRKRVVRGGVVSTIASHLKDSIKGPKRETQDKALARYLELKREAQGESEGSLKFSDVIDKYIEDRKPTAGVRRTIEYLRRELGALKDRDFQAAYQVWIKQQEGRPTVRTVLQADPCPCGGEVSRRGRCKSCGKSVEMRRVQKHSGPISEATLQGYRRYISVIWRHVGRGDLVDRIVVGQPIERRRPIEQWELLKIEESIQALCSWFLPHFRQALECPMRPRDQFALNRADHYDPESGEVAYQTHKTGRLAMPIVPDDVRAHLRQQPGLLYPGPAGESMMPSENNRRYQKVWERVLAHAGVKDLQWKDLRHHAVAQLRSGILADCGLKAQILTKGGIRAARDFDLLQKYKWKFGTTLVGSEAMREQYEPGAATIRDRLIAIDTARDLGIYTWVSVEPVIDPEWALLTLKTVVGCVDLVRLGKINHDAGLESGVDWAAFLREARAILGDTPHMIKADLLKYDTKGA